MEAKKFWLFSLRWNKNEYKHEANCFFDGFPTRADLLEVTDGENYTIIHVHEFTEEQYNKLIR